MITFKQYLSEAIKLKGFGEKNQKLLNFVDDIVNIHPSVTIKATPMNGAVHISDMQSTRSGAGSEALKKIVAHADAKGVDLTLFPRAYDSPDKQANLENWYGRYGFTADSNRPDMFRRKPVGLSEQFIVEAEVAVSSSNPTRKGTSKTRKGTSKTRKGTSNPTRKGTTRKYQMVGPLPVVIDGQATHLQVGKKRPIRRRLDGFIPLGLRKNDRGITLGRLQNQAESDPKHDQYRILQHIGDNHFKTNSSGIFAPLIDGKDHERITVGHVADSTPEDWKQLTTNKNFPGGLSHGDFYDALHYGIHGNKKEYKPAKTEGRAQQLKAMADHPLVKKFLEHHKETGYPPEDFAAKRNLGVWTHPVTGTRHIVARDVGYDENVAKITHETKKAASEAFY